VNTVNTVNNYHDNYVTSDVQTTWNLVRIQFLS